MKRNGGILVSDELLERESVNCITYFFKNCIDPITGVLILHILGNEPGTSWLVVKLLER